MALTFGFPPNSLSTIIRNRDKLRNYDSFNSCSKRRRTCVHEDFDEAVMKWIHTMQDKNVLISEPFVIEKAFPFVKTDHQIGTSVHASQRPMVTCIMMGTVVPGPHGLLCF
ncbi:tigger transposable element-derived protein 4 [Trichonephila clavipes]|nr:tigger transposable element-derived protein 4 [Trichonephila clavipes]